MITIERIDENVSVEYTGDVHVTGSIGKNANVVIKNGSLAVDQNIEANAKISLSHEGTHISGESSGTFFHSSYNLVIHGDADVTIGGKRILTKAANIQVKGNVDNGVTVSSNRANISVNGRIGSQCIFDIGGGINVGDVENNSRFSTKSGGISGGNFGANCSLITGSGGIKTGNFGANCSLMTGSGGITAGNFGANCSLMAGSGGITAGDFGANCSLMAGSGNVGVQNIDPSVLIKTGSGDIYEKGIKRKKSNSQVVVSVSGMNGIFYANSNGYRHSTSSNTNDTSFRTDETHPMTDINMMILGGFMAALGVVAVALALTILNPVIGGILMGVGIGGAIVGGTLFVVGASRSCA